MPQPVHITPGLPIGKSLAGNLKEIMTFSHITHHMGKTPDTQNHKVVRVTPIVRLGYMGEIVLLQGGRVFSDDGEEMALPGWAYEAMSRLTPTALKEAGFEAVPTPPKGLDTTMPDAKAPAMFTCPACSKVMEDGNRVPHLAKHNKHLGPNDQLSLETGKPLH